MFYQQILNTVHKQHKFSLREIYNSLEKSELPKINQIRSKKNRQKVQYLTICCFLPGVGGFFSMVGVVINLYQRNPFNLHVL